MKRLILALVLLVAMTVPVFAIQYESITVANTAIGLTGPLDWTKTEAYCTLETAQVRFRIDGVTAPTSSEGHILNIGEQLTIRSAEAVKNFRAIRTGATSGVLKCSY